MVKKSGTHPSQEPEARPIRWGWIYLWLLVVFGGILLATMQSVERKALEMKMDGLIEKKLSLLNTEAELQVKYQEKQSFAAISRMVEDLHLELAPSPLPPILLAASMTLPEATP